MQSGKVTESKGDSKSSGTGTGNHGSILTSLLNSGSGRPQAKIAFNINGHNLMLVAQYRIQAEILFTKSSQTESIESCKKMLEFADSNARQECFDSFVAAIEISVCGKGKFPLNYKSTIKDHLLALQLKDIVIVDSDLIMQAVIAASLPKPF